MEAIEKKGGIRKIFSPIYGEIEYAMKKYPEGTVIIASKIVGGKEIGYFHEICRGYTLFPVRDLPSWFKEEIYDREYAKIS